MANEITADVPASSASLVSNAQWGITNTLSGFIIQAEDISEERSTDQTINQKGAVVNELDYDKHWTLALTVIGDGTLPAVGATDFAYPTGTLWKVKSVTKNGSYNDKYKYTITAERWMNFPTAG